MAQSILANFTPYEGTEPFIFVSYAHSDSRRVIPILEAMNAQGYRIWYDEGILWGEKWKTSVAEHIMKCSACIAFLSTAFAVSPHCEKELNWATSHNKHIYPAYLEKAALEPGLAMDLDSVHHIDVIDTSTTEFLNIIRRLDEFVTCKKAGTQDWQTQPGINNQKQVNDSARNVFDDSKLKINHYVESGLFGGMDGVEWGYLNNALTIWSYYIGKPEPFDPILRDSQTGKMMDYHGHPPWASKKNKTYTITLNTGVRNIADYAFSDFTSLRHVQIPSSVKRIGAYAFSGCSNLSSVILPNYVRYIGANAFMDCKQLEEVILPDRLCWISPGAFLGCDKLTSVRLPPIMKFPMLFMGGAFNSTTKIEYR